MLVKQLPFDSRYKKLLSKSKLTLEEHLLWDVRDLLLQNTYYTSVGATSGLTKSSARTVGREAPKPIPRPGQPEPERKFMSTKDLADLFKGRRNRLQRGK